MRAQCRVAVGVSVLLAMSAVASWCLARPEEGFPLVSFQSDDGRAVSTVNGVTTIGKWSDSVGRHCWAEGIAMRDTKGLFDELLIQYTALYIQWRNEPPPSGHIVRIRGKLVELKQEAGRADTQTAGRFRAYAISDAQWRSVDAVVAPVLHVQ